MTIIYEMTRRHTAYGGATRVVVDNGTRHDYDSGECVEVDFGRVPRPVRKAVDAGLGRIGLSRVNTVAWYRPAIAAIESGFGGVIVVHNAPAVLRLFRKHCPRARICLYAHNELFRTYTDSETARSLSSADSVVCVSEFLAASLRTRLRRAAPWVAALLNGVDTDRFRPSPGSPKEDPPIVLFVGRVVPQKGPDILIRAALLLAASGRQFKVRVVGSSGFSAADPLTPYELDLRRLAAPIRERVEFQPFVARDRVLDEYLRATVFCAPSNWDEPCSLTVPEAMGCGLPVVASCRGGLPDVGGDAVEYFSPPDHDALASRLALLLDDPEVRRVRGRRARARAEMLSWDNQYRQFREMVGLGERGSLQDRVSPRPNAAVGGERDLDA
jgi:glycosyltransferase involved in cell wall biosynthesis